MDNVAAYRKENPSVRILHWVSIENSQTFSVVTYDKLLLQNDEVNPKSKIIYPDAQIPT